MSNLERSRLARVALAAWVNVSPDQLPAAQMWVEHPSDANRQAWDRVVRALSEAVCCDVRALAVELRETVERMETDPSPHAPEIPFMLREDIAALLDALGEPLK